MYVILFIMIAFAVLHLYWCSDCITVMRVIKNKYINKWNKSTTSWYYKTVTMLWFLWKGSAFLAKIYLYFWLGVKCDLWHEMGQIQPGMMRLMGLFDTPHTNTTSCFLMKLHANFMLPVSHTTNLPLEQKKTNNV